MYLSCIFQNHPCEILSVLKYFSGYKSSVIILHRTVTAIFIFRLLLFNKGFISIDTSQVEDLLWNYYLFLKLLDFCLITGATTLLTNLFEENIVRLCLMSIRFCML